MKINFLTLLTIVFVIAKLTKHVDWSWWIVFAPIWIPLAIVLVVIFFAAIVSYFR